MGGIRDQNVRQTTLDSERQFSHVFSHINNLKYFLKDIKVEGRLLGKKTGTKGRRKQDRARGG
jgi:hypothetical protein